MNKILFFLFFIAINANTQTLNFSAKEKSKLLKIEPHLNEYHFNNESINCDLKNVLFFDKKRKQNKTWAYIFTGLGILYAGVSVDLLNKDNVITDFISVTTITASVASFGASIPFYIGVSKNKRKAKEKLIFINDELTSLK